MAYKCTCGAYVYEILELCRQCELLYGSYNDWPDDVKDRYFELNFGGDYEYSDLDKLGRPGSVKAAPIGKAGDILSEVTDPILGERSGKRCPVCNARIKPKDRLCSKCFAEYGGDESKWPEWLAGKFVNKLINDKWKTEWLDGIVTMNQKEVDAARNHRESSIDDETFSRRQAPTHAGKAGGKIAGGFGGRTVARTNQDEISNEMIYWSDDELDAAGPNSVTDAPITGDRNGQKYNAAAWRGGNDQFREIGGYSERDSLEDKIAAEQELNQWNPQAAAVLLLSENGYSQKEVAELMKIRQQKVSEILRKAVKRG